MEFTITIPVFGILTFFAIYALIGLVLFVPLAMWQNRFISGNDSWHKSILLPQAVFHSMVFWPFMLGYSAWTEISYRKKGYL